LASKAYISVEKSYTTLESEIKEPITYNEAISTQEKEIWLKSMTRELETLSKNDTWTLVDLPIGKKAISTKWVYKIKKNDDKSIQYKSRFVARGFEQIYGLNYEETFAAVIKPMSYKTIIALAAIFSWYIYKIDMKSAFSQGDLDEEVYIRQPEGFEDPQYPNKVLRLNKALYGLKQSAKIWYDTLSTYLKGFQFMQLDSDYCIYQNKAKNTFLLVYVDDIAIIGPDIDYINLTIKKLSNKFELKNLGPIKTYLGVEIEQKNDYISLSQKDYIIKILKRFNLYDVKPVATPIEPKFNNEKNIEIAPKDDITWYQQAIGSLLYAAINTRPDIAYTVSVLGRFASNPSENHKIAVKRVFRYLRGTLDYNIRYYRSNNSGYLTGYTDSDYAGDKNEYKSTSGYIFYLANGPISYSSKLQSITAQSSTEAEYIALCNATKEAIYLRGLLIEIGHFQQEKIPIYTDNNGAIQLAKNPVFHSRTKHINVRYHYIRQQLDVISVLYKETNKQPADGLTKPLVKIKHQEFLKLLGII
jgi:Reverse transcriptase (RNA-dependent DNA polymerase)